MAPPSSERRESKAKAKMTTTARHVAFAGAECIEFDAERPAVVRLCGTALAECAGGYSAALECEARGLDEQAVAAAGGSAARALEAQHAEEARQMLARRGFSPLSEDLRELQTQLRAADLLLAWSALVDADASADLSARLEAVVPCDWRTRTLADPSLLACAELAKKELAGRVDDNYVFGRRFVSAEAFVDALERSEVLALAQQRGLPLPAVGAEEKAAMEVPDRALVALRGPGAGKTLKQLTLRELVAEAQAHGVDVEHERGAGASKSKRAWVDILRPLVREDMLKIRVLMQEEVLLRELVTRALEHEAAEDQRRRVQALVRSLVEQTEGSQDCEPNAEPALEPLDANNDALAMVDGEDKRCERLDRYFARLAAAFRPE